MNTSSPGWKVWFYKYTYIELPNHNATNGNKLCRVSINPVLQLMKQRPQKTLVAVTYTWLGFFLVKCTCHQFTLLLPSRGHVLWGSSLSGHREWGIFVSRNTKKIESKWRKPSCYQVWAPTSKLSYPTYRPPFSVTPCKKKKMWVLVCLLLATCGYFHLLLTYPMSWGSSCVLGPARLRLQPEEKWMSDSCHFDVFLRSPSTCQYAIMKGQFRTQ